MNKDKLEEQLNTDILQAIKSGNIKLVQQLVNDGKNINAEDENGQTPLFCAVLEENIDIIELLVKFGSDIEAKDKNGRTPLHIAAFFAKILAVQQLIKLGANTEATDKDGLIPFRLAVLEKHSETYSLLIPQNETILNAELFNSIKYGDTEAIEHLVKAGADVNAVDKDGYTALYYAVFEKSDVCIKLLVELGADINAVDKDGYTALHLAVSKESDICIKLLVDLGADVNAVDKDGYTALYYAVFEKSDVCIKLLVELGASIAARDKKGNTPLSLAIITNYSEIYSLLTPKDKDLLNKELFNSVLLQNTEAIEYLVKSGADVNAVDKDGYTALHHAVSKKSDICIKLLVNLGANINAVDKDCYTALHHAVFKKNDLHIKLLADLGANIEAKCKKGLTPLQYAAIAGNTLVVQQLIKLGANTEATNKDGLIPFRLAVLEKHSEIYSLLVPQNETLLNAELFNSIKHGDMEAIEHLIKAGANVNLMNESEVTTPLLYAILHGQKEVAKLLLEVGVNINSIIKDGNTILHLISVSESQDAMIMLKELGADLEVKNAQGMTRLHMAAATNQINVINLLVKLGANINSLGHDNNTPLHYAVFKRRAAAIKLLVELGANKECKNKQNSSPVDYANKNEYYEIIDLLDPQIKNIYTILGLNKNATDKEVNKKYKKQILIDHPDKGGDEEKFKELQRVYEEWSLGLNLSEEVQEKENVKPFYKFESWNKFNEYIKTTNKETLNLETSQLPLSNRLKIEHKNHEEKFRKDLLRKGMDEEFPKTNIPEELPSVNLSNLFRPFSSDLYDGETDIFSYIKDKSIITQNITPLKPLDSLLTSKLAIRIFIGFLEGRYYGNNLLKIIKYFEHEISRLMHTGCYHPQTKLYEAIYSIMDMAEKTVINQQKLLSSINKITEYAKVTVDESILITSPLFESEYFRHLLAHALHLYWQADEQDFAKENCRAFNGLELAKKEFNELRSKLSVKTSDEEQARLNDKIYYVNSLYKIEKDLSIVEQKGGNSAAFYREAAYKLADWIDAIKGRGSLSITINILLQAGAYFQRASSIQTSVTDEKKSSAYSKKASLMKATTIAEQMADEKLALHMYILAVNTAHEAMPHVELYSIIQSLKAIANFKFKDEIIFEIVKLWQDRCLKIADIFPIFDFPQSNMSFYKGDNESQIFIHKFLHELIRSSDDRTINTRFC